MLQPGEKAPEFCLKNTFKEEICLQEFRGESAVVVLFFPLAFTSVCTTELCMVRDDLVAFDTLNAVVLGISVDSHYALGRFRSEQNINFHLLSDFNKTVCKEYGAWYEDFFGMHGVAKRAAFVVDMQGHIRYSEVLDDASKLPDLEQIKTVLAGLK